MKNIYKLQINMANIRFKNLPSLLNDIKRKSGLLIRSFFSIKMKNILLF